MARHETVVLVDDLSGEEGENVRTREFAIDGVTYTIDLDEENSNELDDVLAVYMERGRRVGGRVKTSKPRGAGGASADREQNRAIRKWASENGYELADRGRIPGEVVQAYNERAGRPGLAAAS